MLSKAMAASLLIFAAPSAARASGAPAALLGA